MGAKITNRERAGADSGLVRTTEELGGVVRAARRARRLTLEEVYASTSLSTRFLSELERGKPNASLGRTLRALEALGLDVLIVPRAHTASVVRQLRERMERERA